MPQSASACTVAPTIVSEVTWNALGKFTAANALTDALCDVRGTDAETTNYWAGDGTSGFVVDFGCSRLITKTLVRNSHNGPAMNE